MLNLKYHASASIIAMIASLSMIAISPYANATSATSEARAEIARMVGDVRNAEHVKADVLSVLEQARTLAKGEDLESANTLIRQVENMSYEEILGTFNEDFIAKFSRFESVLNHLKAIQSSQKKMASSANQLSTMATNINLRDASYTPLCGSTRADTTATIIALGVFLVAEAVKEAAVSGCGTVVVVLGNGGSPQSAVCSGVVAGVFQIARGVWEEFLICQDSIDSAEILGTYQRAEDIFDSLNAHDTEIKAQVEQHDTEIKAQVVQHDTEIKAQVMQHDTEIKAQVVQHDTDIKARLDQLDGKLDNAIELLLTPQGKRPGWNQK